ncbi:MAG: hypothetical protein RL215_1463, partial [Planctomycetota bacterium]
MGMESLSGLLSAVGLDQFAGLWIDGQSVICGGHLRVMRSPIDGGVLGEFREAESGDVDRAVLASVEAFRQWRMLPAPYRGELVRRFGLELREHQSALAQLVTLESGKILAESLGEVQEMIDICDYAVGLSRQLCGLTMATERRRHRMMEQWHPLGPVGVITAFNFPVAVWAWNAAIAFVCGDPVIWKPSERASLTAMSCQRLLMRAASGLGEVPAGLSTLVLGGREAGQMLAEDRRVPLISATGSVQMGREVARTVAGRLGRTLLELGGNNACIVTADANLDLAVRAIVFSAAGTCGQRCTTLRRLIVHEEIADELVNRLRVAYASLPIGNPLETGVLVGPLIDGTAGDRMQVALSEARHAGGTIFGGEVLSERVPVGGCYVRPAIVEMPIHADVMYEETFAPILYVLRYREFSEAIEMQNCVPQGLASSIFTNDLREAEEFLSAAGSDCGIANVNIG